MCARESARAQIKRPNTVFFFSKINQAPCKTFLASSGRRGISGVGRERRVCTIGRSFFVVLFLLGGNQVKIMTCENSANSFKGARTSFEKKIANYNKYTVLSMQNLKSKLNLVCENTKKTNTMCNTINYCSPLLRTITCRICPFLFPPDGIELVLEFLHGEKPCYYL